MSVSTLVNGAAREKLKGPTGVSQSKPTPTELLILFELSIELS